jgi:hypothetical protein
LVVFAVALSLGSASAAFAGDSLLASGTRMVREAERSLTPGSLPRTTAPAKSAPAKPGTSAVPALAQTTSAVATSPRFSKRTKVLILVGAAVGYTAAALTIDHHVQDVTPSTLGTREDR